MAAALFGLAYVLIAWAVYAHVSAQSDSTAVAAAPPGVPDARTAGAPGGRQTERREAGGDARPGARERPAGDARTSGDTREDHVPLPLRKPDLAPAVPDPERVSIPALGVRRDLIELAVVGTSLQVPQDYSDVGWWSGGPSPGEQGAAVMVGHVDSLTGPAVFYGLSSLERGDRIEVRREDGSRRVFAVRTTRVYDRDEVPSQQVYRTHGRPSLHLLTCGGAFDQDAGRYTDNVVVYAELVDRPRGQDDPQHGGTGGGGGGNGAGDGDNEGRPG